MAVGAHQREREVGWPCSFPGHLERPLPVQEHQPDLLFAQPLVQPALHPLCLRHSVERPVGRDAGPGHQLQCGGGTGFTALRLGPQPEVGVRPPLLPEPPVLQAQHNGPGQAVRVAGVDDRHPGLALANAGRLCRRMVHIVGTCPTWA